MFQCSSKPGHQMGKKMRNTHFFVDDLTPRIDPLLVQYRCHHGCTATTSRDINLPSTPGTTSNLDAREIMGAPGARPVPLAMHYYRKPAMVVSIIDGVSYTFSQFFFSSIKEYFLRI